MATKTRLAVSDVKRCQRELDDATREWRRLLERETLADHRYAAWLRVAAAPPLELECEAWQPARQGPPPPVPRWDRVEEAAASMVKAQLALTNARSALAGLREAHARSGWYRPPGCQAEDPCCG